jgi:hypothetical protein
MRDWQMEQWRSRLRRIHLLAGLTQSEAEHILTAELGRLRKADLADSIKDATVIGVRDKKPFRYISARNLFFAIQDALDQVKAEGVEANGVKSKASQ